MLSSLRQVVCLISALSRQAAGSAAGGASSSGLPHAAAAGLLAQGPCASGSSNNIKSCWALGRLLSSSGLRQEDLLLPKVTIIGRPNVGKSALFNKLLRRKAALVYDTPDSHVTRDFKEGVGRLGDLRFRVVDTSGLEPDKPQRSIQGRAVDITARVVKGSDVTLLVVDAKTGLVATDEELAQWLKRLVHADKILVVANKAENQRARQGMSTTVHDCYRLGFGEPVAISAATGEGMVDLYTALQPYVDEAARRLQQRGVFLPGSSSLPAVAAAPAAAVAEAPVATGRAGAIARVEVEGARAADGLAETGGRGGEGGLEVERAGHGGAAAAGEGVASGSGDESWFDAATAGGWERRGVGDAGAAAAWHDDDQDSVEAAGEAEEEEVGAELSALGQEGEKQAPLRLAILGQPNVGKSTLLNALLQEQRALTGPEPGLTRDAVHASMTHNGVHIELVDTAGWIGVTRGAEYDDVGGTLADMARRESARALAAAHVAVLVLDAQRAVQMQRVMTQRELSLAGLVLSEGRALVVVANKLDTLPPQHRATYLGTLRSALEERFLEAGQLPIIGMSALTSKGVEDLLPVVQRAYDRWNRRVSTGQVNRFLAKLTAGQSLSRGGIDSTLQRIKYMTQVKARPPSFAAFLSGSQHVDDGFVRFLAAQLRESLGFEGVPVRIFFRYKEARSAQQRERLRTRGRPLALRAPKTRQRQLKVQRRGRGPSFRDAAENLLNEIAGRPDKARSAGREGEGARPPRQPGGRQQSQADRRGEPREQAGDVRGEEGEEWRGAGAAAERPTQGARRQQGAGTDGAQGLGGRGASSGPGARRAGGVSKAEMTARLLIARKPSAPVFPLKQGPSKKAKKAAASAAAGFKGAAQG